MREIVETGTDVASVAVGDPTLLEALRSSAGRAYIEERSKAVQANALWRSETGADGSYLFHVFVEEDPPPAVAAFLRDPLTVERLRVPSGRLLVAGEECFVGATSASDYSHLGREIRVTPGDYQLTAYRGEAPDDYLDLRFAEQAGMEQRKAWRLGNSIPVWSGYASIAALVAAYLIYLRTFSVGLALAPLACAALGWLWQARYRRSPEYQSAQALFLSIARETPSIALVMRRCPTSGPTTGGG